MTTENSTFRCLEVQQTNSEQDAPPEVSRAFCERTLDELASLKDEAGQVVIDVEYSSLNYKDALAATGHPGVARRFPLVPGIDAAGLVVSSQDPKFSPGDKVLVFHGNFGTKCNGGWARRIQVPGNWVYKLPASLSARDAMTIGTGGFTAAQCVDQLIRHEIKPGDGEIVVSGATGGVGIFAVKLLAELGYQVVASTGKSKKAQQLIDLGAVEVISRNDLDDQSDTPLLKARWAGAVDTVGGNTLATIIRATRPGGCVTACGLVGGNELKTTVYPYILRGVTLQGIDTAGIDYDYRESLWGKIGSQWKPTRLDQIADEIAMDELEDRIQKILRGEIFGRVVVRVA